MTVDKAVQILQEMYDAAPRGDKTVTVHLFGIKYGQDIRASGLSVREISRRALKKNYEPVINDGIKLGKYVELRGRPRLGKDRLSSYESGSSVGSSG